MLFDVKPVEPLILPKNEKERQDWELLNAISTAIHMCGFNGEDVSMMSIEVLKQIGRYDLLPQCER